MSRALKLGKHTNPFDKRLILKHRGKLVLNLFLGVDAEVRVGFSWSSHQLPNGRVEFSDEAVVAALQGSGKKHFRRVPLFKGLR